LKLIVYLALFILQGEANLWYMVAYVAGFLSAIFAIWVLMWWMDKRDEHYILRD